MMSVSQPWLSKAWPSVALKVHGQAYLINSFHQTVSIYQLHQLLVGCGSFQRLSKLEFLSEKMKFVTWLASGNAENLFSEERPKGRNF